MTTLLNLLNASIECNNLGVVLLHAGDLENALDSFMTAAKLMHPVSKQIQSCSVDDDCENFWEPGFEIPQGIRRIVQESVTSIAIKGKRPAVNAFVCAEPIHLELVSRLPEACILESAVVVHNMALAYHLQDSDQYLKRALALYDTVFNLSCSLNTDKLASTLAMSALNNAGQIYHALGEYHISRRYLDALRVYILKLPLPVDSHTVEVRQRFLLNAALLRPPTVASAA